MKKVCQVGFLKFGVGHYIAHLYPHLASQFDLTVVSYTHASTGEPLTVNDEIITQNVKKYRQLINPHGWAASYRSANNLFDLFAREKFDVFNLHISTYVRYTSFLFIPLIEYFKKQALRIVYTMHDVLPFPEKEIITPYLTYFYNLADAAIVGNDKERQNLADYFHFQNDTAVATHGIYDLFNSHRLSQTTALQILQIPPDKNRLLFFGALRDNKGLADLLKALKILIQQNDNFHLTVAVSIKEASDFDQYQALIDRFGLRNSVKIFIKDYIHSKDIETQFQAADLVVLPYTDVSQSGILNLAFAFEKPMIITDVFAEKDLVDKSMGLVAKTHNPQDLADTIRVFFNHKEEITAYVANIQEYNKTHTFAETAKVYQKVFENLI
ncbi:glycosyltransferase [Candidatus Roizmanbacteria bacterium]|nr:glycosyltransferase [Candidatus Roizmanbacteria bacterium]